MSDIDDLLNRARQAVEDEARMAKAEPTEPEADHELLQLAERCAEWLERFDLDAVVLHEVTRSEKSYFYGPMGEPDWKMADHVHRLTATRAGDFVLTGGRVSLRDERSWASPPFRWQVTGEFAGFIEPTWPVPGLSTREEQNAYPRLIRNHEQRQHNYQRDLPMTIAKWMVETGYPDRPKR